MSKRRIYDMLHSKAGLCSDASLEVFYGNYLREVFYVENQ